ncbi:MAG: UDP-N-acetylglucosamine 1-carboxyvinyltransferase [Chloroflexota bacterium]|nr:MAG: UDP-N-acetylglucosamine 1-carboxyvinyltransferase [Chloroflexota bacterium]
MSGDRFVVRGGVPLRGAVQISGSKNAALPILAAALLTREEVVLDNLPLIEDIRRMLALLGSLGVKIDLDESAHRVRIRSADLRSFTIDGEHATAMRASFLTMGPLLARVGQGIAPAPGGCAIGRRPVNVDIKGFTAMGATCREEDGVYKFTADRLVGQRLYLDYPSHTGTENLLMAACLAKGRTIIKHASTEPEVVALAECLVRMGAKIRGAGSSLIEIEGVGELYGVHLRCLSDRIEAGTFAIAGLMTGGDVTLHDVNVAHLEPVTHKLADVGGVIEEGDNWVRVRANGHLRACELQTLPYPGFPTDLQACFAALLTQAEGTSFVHERVFDDRLGYVSELRKLGADIRTSGGQTAHIDGPSQLHGAETRAGDLRAGAALILAGLVADGETEISDIHHIDRGYEQLDGKLRNLGARIERVRVREPARASHN